MITWTNPKPRYLMTASDRANWNGKHITGKNPRVEIRKTLQQVGNLAAQMLIVVSKDGVRLSMNGIVNMSFKDWNECDAVIWEALNKLLGSTP